MMNTHTFPLPAFLLAEPLCVHPPAMLSFLQRHQALTEKARAAAAMSMSTGPEERQLSIADFVNQRREYSVADGIATIHVNDVLARNTTGIDRLLGMTDYSHLIAELDQAAAAPDVHAILVDINSPGGSAVGAPEAAAAVADAAAVKPVVAYIETVGASAAYFLASAATAIVASPSAIIGSIGTISVFADFAGLLERAGITPHIVTPQAADLKATGNPLRAPTLQESLFLQQRSESINALFTGWVQQYRPGVDPSSMRGQWFSGAEALALGLVDQLGTMADAIAAAEALARMPALTT